MRCLEHMKVIEILRLKEMNLFTYRDIAASVDCSKTTVGEILSRCKKHGLTYVGGKMILPPHGKEFFTRRGKQFFTSTVRTF